MTSTCNKTTDHAKTTLSKCQRTKRHGRPKGAVRPLRQLAQGCLVGYEPLSRCRKQGKTCTMLTHKLPNLAGAVQARHMWLRCLEGCQSDACLPQIPGPPATKTAWCFGLQPLMALAEVGISDAIPGAPYTATSAIHQFNILLSCSTTRPAHSPSKAPVMRVPCRSPMEVRESKHGIPPPVLQPLPASNTQ